MDVAHTLIDIAACEQLKEDPCLVIPRGKGEIWFVPTEPMEKDKRLTWEFYKQNEHVRIPLFPYITSTQPELAMAYIFSLAFKVAGQLDKPVRKLHIAIGMPLVVVPRPPHGDCLQYWLGFGLILEK